MIMNEKLFLVGSINCMCHISNR